MTRADYGLGSAASSADRVAASSKSVAARPGPAGSSSAPFSANRLSSMDLAAAMHVGDMAMPAVGAAMAGGGGRYLVHERRGLWGQASYNIGYSYTLGLVMGGLYGVLSGVRSSPNSNPRVVLNSVLNGCGKFGARAGNATGVLALLYTLTERQLEDLEIDRLPGSINNLLGSDLFERARTDAVLPAAAAFTTGVLFTIPRAVTMKGVDRVHLSFPKRLAVVSLGGLAMMAGVGTLALGSPLLFGDRSPFRFA
jgi:hypothetical protein